MVVGRHARQNVKDIGHSYSYILFMSNLNRATFSRTKPSLFMHTRPEQIKSTQWLTGLISRFVFARETVFQTGMKRRVRAETTKDDREGNWNYSFRRQPVVFASTQGWIHVPPAASGVSRNSTTFSGFLRLRIGEFCNILLDDLFRWCFMVDESRTYFPKLQRSSDPIR